MKNWILSFLVITSTSILFSQTIELPGTGIASITVSEAQISTSSHLKFSNSEYKVIGFDVSFPTVNNTHYSASSLNNKFTDEMVDNAAHRLHGADLQLKVTLKSQSEHASTWSKSYVVHVSN